MAMFNSFLYVYTRVSSSNQRTCAYAKRRRECFSLESAKDALTRGLRAVDGLMDAMVSSNAIKEPDDFIGFFRIFKGFFRTL